MSIQQLTSVQQQFTRHLQTIRQQSKNIQKSIILRIQAWLKKLCSVIDNFFWRKNRNLYAQVLALMLQNHCLQPPFDKFPMEGSLPKLNIYEIPYGIRKKMQCHKQKEKERVKQQKMKQNNLELSNLSLNRVSSVQVNNLRCKKRHSFALKSLNTMLQNPFTQKSICQNLDNIQNQNQNIQTQRKHNRSKSNKKNKTKNINQQIKNVYNSSLNKKKQNQSQKQLNRLVNTLQDVLQFLAKNNKKFMEANNNGQYIQLMKQIVEYGDKNNRDFRQLKFSVINQ